MSAQGVIYNNCLLARQALTTKVWNRGKIDHSTSLPRHMEEAGSLFPNHDVILFVKRTDLPDDITISFEVTGFGKDFSRFCEYIVFCSYLYNVTPSGEQTWNRGFALTLEKIESHELETVWDRETHPSRITLAEEEHLAAIFGRQMLPFLEQTIFIALFSSERTPLFGPPLFCPTVHELGHIRNHAEVRESGKRVIDMSEAAQEFYAGAYERRAALALIKALTSMLRTRKINKLPGTQQSFMRLMQETVKRVAGISSATDFMRSLLQGSHSSWLPDTHRIMLGHYEQLEAEGGAGLYRLSPNKHPRNLRINDPLSVSLRA